MKKLFVIFASAALLFAGCGKEYDDSVLTGRVDGLENRVARLEELCKQMNTNISSLQTIVTALQNNDYVTAVTPVTRDGETIGYTISFTESSPITIYHGQNGKDGINGSDGKDGANGADGHTPVIGVRQDADGIYYWTLDGEWLPDNAGNKVKAEGRDGHNGADGKDGVDGSDGKDGQDGKDGVNGSDGKDGVDGSDGKDGQNGADGKDGVTPQLKIEDGCWYVSTDNGTTWTNLGKATGEDGKDGADGKDGKDGDLCFKSIDTSNNEYIIFTLADDTTIKLPTWHAFEQLRILCNQMNTNINAMQTIVTALQNNDYVKNITPVMQDGREIGYTIIFNKSNPVTIYHGQNGKDGINGSDGKDGANGADGHTPIIGVRQDADGIYYWTLDGEWLLDNAGNKVKAEGRDGHNGADGKDGVDGSDGEDGVNGSDGQDGADGKDGVTPQLKIEGGYWYVSTDNGTTWTNLGKATGENGKDGTDGSDGKDGDSMFRSVTQDGNNVYFTLADGTVIAVSKFDIEKMKIIKFTDPYVKMLCIVNWDTDGDKELSYEEAAAVTDIGTVFKGQPRMVEFDEFKYFTALTRIPESAFSRCGLVNITLPNGVRTIEKSAFSGCDLRCITLSEELISIEESAFSDCGDLTGTLIIPDKVTTIGKQAFLECNNLNILVLGESIVKIGAYAFAKRITGTSQYDKLKNISKVYCKSKTVPSMGIFEDNVYKHAFGNESRIPYLGVPIGCGAIYKANTRCREQFTTIEEVKF